MMVVGDGRSSEATSIESLQERAWLAKWQAGAADECQMFAGPGVNLNLSGQVLVLNSGFVERH